jgi:cell wall-associated NlpC family hydrolase
MAIGSGSVVAAARVVYRADLTDLRRGHATARREFQDTASHLERHSSRLGGTLAVLGKTALFAGGAAGIGGLFAVLRTGSREMVESQKVTAQTEAVLKSTGGVANATKKQIEGLADALMRKTGVDDENIQAGENWLLTFRKVRNEAGRGNDIFTQATKTTLDLAAAQAASKGTAIDMATASTLMGKALNDPIRGVTALNRAGVTFTKAQRDQIKALVDSGKTLEAQKLILREVRTQVEGSAEAYGKTLPGRLGILRESFANLSGELIGRLAPALTTAATTLTGWINWLATSERFHEIVRASIAKIVEIMKALWPILSGIGAVFAAVWGAIKTIAVEVGHAFSNIFKIFSGGGDSGPGKAKSTMETLHDVAKVLGDILKNYVVPAIELWAKITATQIRITAKIVEVEVKIIVAVIRTIITIVEKVIAIVEAIPGVFRKAWAAVTSTVQGFITFLGELPGKALTKAEAIGKSTVRGVVNGLAGLVAGARGIFQDLWDWIKGAAGSAYAFARNVGLAVVRGIKAGIESAWHGLTSWVSDKMGDLKHTITHPWEIFSPSRWSAREVGVPIVEGIAVGIELATPVAERAAAVAAKRIQDAASGAVAALPPTGPVNAVAAPPAPAGRSRATPWPTGGAQRGDASSGSFLDDDPGGSGGGGGAVERRTYRDGYYAGGHLHRRGGRWYLRLSIGNREPAVPLRAEIGPWLEKWIGRGLSPAAAIMVHDWWAENFPAIEHNSRGDAIGDLPPTSSTRSAWSPTVALPPRAGMALSIAGWRKLPSGSFEIQTAPGRSGGIEPGDRDRGVTGSPPPGKRVSPTRIVGSEGTWNLVGGQWVAGGTTTAPPPKDPATDPRAQRMVEGVVKYAMAQQGDPYEWGKTGPGSFDCSGLMWAAYQSIGIDIPRTTQGQWAAGKAVTAPQPGDGVYYEGRKSARNNGPPPRHMAIYIGGGMQIEAGDPIHTGPVRNEGFMGYRRFLPDVASTKPTTPRKPPTPEFGPAGGGKVASASTNKAEQRQVREAGQLANVPGIGAVVGRLEELQSGEQTRQVAIGGGLGKAPVTTRFTPTIKQWQAELAALSKKLRAALARLRALGGNFRKAQRLRQGKRVLDAIRAAIKKLNAVIVELRKDIGICIAAIRELQAEAASATQKAAGEEETVDPFDPMNFLEAPVEGEVPGGAPAGELGVVPGGFEGGGGGAGGGFGGGGDVGGGAGGGEAPTGPSFTDLETARIQREAIAGQREAVLSYQQKYLRQYAANISHRGPDGQMVWGSQPWNATGTRGAMPPPPTNVTINNNMVSPPPDPNVWIRNAAFHARAAGAFS